MIEQLVDVTDTRWAQVFDIWLRTNIEAHDFIPESYWQDSLPFVKESIPQATVYVYEEQGEVLGFIGLENEYIAGIFVKSEAQGKGIGQKILNSIKEKYNQLSLSVYSENIRALNFYLKENFYVISESSDETGHLEKAMVWKKQ